MISDEPDEDADTLDDEGLLESFIRPDVAQQGSTQSGSGSASAPPVQEWPLSRPHGLELDLDPETFAWFKANHANWREAMGTVLRSWIAVNEQVPGTIQPSG